MLLVAALLAFLCVIAVLYPFFRRDTPESGGVGEAEAAAENAGLEAVLDSIRTLQLERQLNRVTEEAYEEQLMGYRLEAASLLRRRDEVRESGAEHDLERDVLFARLAVNGIYGEGPVCAGCGASVPGESESCPACGRQVSQTEPEHNEATEE